MLEISARMLVPFVIESNAPSMEPLTSREPPEMEPTAEMVLVATRGPSIWVLPLPCMRAAPLPPEGNTSSAQSWDFPP